MKPSDSTCENRQHGASLAGSTWDAVALMLPRRVGHVLSPQARRVLPERKAAHPVPAKTGLSSLTFISKSLNVLPISLCRRLTWMGKLTCLHVMMSRSIQSREIMAFRYMWAQGWSLETGLTGWDVSSEPETLVQGTCGRAWCTCLATRRSSHQCWHLVLLLSCSTWPLPQFVISAKNQTLASFETVEKLFVTKLLLF